MASSLNLVLAIISIAIISISQNPNSPLVVKADEALIENLCSKTSEPGICKDCLHGDPSSPAADAAGLARISVTCAVRSATRFMDDVSNLLNTSTDPHLKHVLYECKIDNMIARFGINSTFLYIDKNDFYHARENMYGAFESVRRCANLFRSELPAMPVPDLIAVETDVVKQDCEVVEGLLTSVIGD